MEAKHKAAELINKFKPFVQFKIGVEPSYVLKMSKECAYIAADEVLKYSKAHGFIGLTEEYEQLKKEIKLL